MSRIILTAVVVSVAFALNLPAGADVELDDSVVGAGGTLCKGSHKAFCTIGQPVIGVVGNASNTNKIGFWYRHEKGCAAIGDELESEVVARFWLGPGCPNPFYSATTVQFAVPDRSHVKVIVYDVAGREIATLVNCEVDPGRHEVLFDSGRLASGIYFCQMVAPGYVGTRKLVLLK